MGSLTLRFQGASYGRGSDNIPLPCTPQRKHEIKYLWDPELIISAIREYRLPEGGERREKASQEMVGKKCMNPAHSLPKLVGAAHSIPAGMHLPQNHAAINTGVHFSPLLID